MQGQHHFFVMTAKRPAKRPSVLDIIIIFWIVVLFCNVFYMSPQIKRANLDMMTLERSGHNTSTRNVYVTCSDMLV